MAKILFDISDTETVADWYRSHLVMEVSTHIFSYTVLYEAMAVKIRVYELYAENNHELKEELEEMINTDEILKKQIGQRTVVYNFPESQLVPEAYFHDAARQDLTELVHGDLNTGIVLSEKIEDWDQYNVFSVPAEIHHLFQRSFVNGNFRHYYSVWMKWGKKQMASDDGYLSVIFYPRRLLVAAIKNKELQLLQSFAYEAVEDVAYYLLNICGQLELSPENTLLKLSGMIDESSALYTEIFKYFGHVEMDAAPATVTIADPQEFPTHFFSPLLKTAVCVS